MDNTQRGGEVRVLETTKVSEILDQYNNLRYKVILLNQINYTELGKTIEYKIQVLNCFQQQQPITIVSVPSEGECILSFQEAEKIYIEYVQLYTNLVKAMSGDLQNMDIYAQNIGYKVTTPTCCATCKWVKRNTSDCDFIVGVSGKLECHNPKNTGKYDFDCEHGYNPEYNDCGKYKNKYYVQSELNIMPSTPRVSLFGVCDNYELNEKQYVPSPGDSINQIIDNRLNYSVKNTVKDVISTDINPLVQNMIEENIPIKIIPAVTENINNQLSLSPPIIFGNGSNI